MEKRGRQDIISNWIEDDTDTDSDSDTNTSEVKRMKSGNRSWGGEGTEKR